MRRILNTKQNMKRIFLYAALSLVLFSCRNGVETEKESEPLAPRPKVAKCIEEAFAYFIKHEINPDTATVYSMSFIKGEPEFPGEDTMISFCPHNRHMPIEGFKGLIYIQGYRIWVIDKKNIGNFFYTQDSLVKVDIDTLKLPTEIPGCAGFIVCGDYLELWGCQPDDFERIKIDRLNPENP